MRLKGVTPYIFHTSYVPELQMWQNVVLNNDKAKNKNKNAGLNLPHIAVHLIFRASAENTAYYITDRIYLLRRFTHTHKCMHIIAFAYSSRK
jgi:hypothetical protein